MVRLFYMLLSFTVMSCSTLVVVPMSEAIESIDSETKVYITDKVSLVGIVKYTARTYAQLDSFSANYGPHFASVFTLERVNSLFQDSAEFLNNNIDILSPRISTLTNAEFKQYIEGSNPINKIYPNPDRAPQTTVHPKLFQDNDEEYVLIISVEDLEYDANSKKVEFNFYAEIFHRDDKKSSSLQNLKQKDFN
jgi:hypothetical protein